MPGQPRGRVNQCLPAACQWPVCWPGATLAGVYYAGHAAVTSARVATTQNQIQSHFIHSLSDKCMLL